jgi:hypothetical protein
MSGGPLAATIARAVAPQVARLIKQLGSDCALARQTPDPSAAPRADGSTVRRWVRTPGTTGADRVLIQKVSADKAARVWGLERKVVAQGMAPIALDLAEGDALKVVAGQYAGEQFIVAACDADQTAGIRLLGLASTREVLP